MSYAVIETVLGEPKSCHVFSNVDEAISLANTLCDENAVEKVDWKYVNYADDGQDYSVSIVRVKQKD